MREGGNPESSKIIGVFDNDAACSELLRAELEKQDYSVISASQFRSVVAALELRLDLIITEFSLPGIEGLALIKTLREAKPNVPIIVLSSQGDDQAKIAALDAGADDFVVKPYGEDEFAARVRAALRSNRRDGPGDSTHLRLAMLDDERRSIRLRGKDIALTAKEYALMKLLMQHAGEALTHTFLLKNIWGSAVDAQLLRVCVRSLRQKIEANPERPTAILTERGLGYRLVPSFGLGSEGE